MTYFILISTLFIAVNILDWYLTKRIIDNGGRELNPILRKFGVARMKLIVCPVLILVGYLLHWVALIVPTLIIAGVCVWNYRVLSKI